ncbi:thioredoxin domain-containing protein [Rubripirellula sp.]|nr:thioredoxin domain-containing protein [Rubripirellula sp.]MDB4338996.1 thioredoxin domain-containing protein [Rubripirellula sp.]
MFNRVSVFCLAFALGCSLFASSGCSQEGWSRSEVGSDQPAVPADQPAVAPDHDRAANKGTATASTSVDEDEKQEGIATVDSVNQPDDDFTEKTDATGDRGDPETEEVLNRLADESSPYLLQHCRNPVDWYPWGQEAFDKAKREGKLVFLSVGYAACHWCHVMERESFEDTEIAQLLNERFVCVKVDREERPDVDQIYMTAVQLISGGGGWPMSVFLLPDAKPFWGGTYFPARDGDRGNTTGFLTILSQIDLAWKEQTDQVRAQSVALTNAIRERQVTNGGVMSERTFDRELISEVLNGLRTQYDPVFGGFASSGDGPKFPEPSNLLFLSAYAAAMESVAGTEAISEPGDAGSNPGLLEGSQEKTPDLVVPTVRDSVELAANEMLMGTLDGMIRGGMYDHLGGGFHRYSVDPRWEIPHFEKMLYDNAQLASVFAEASVRTGNAEYRLIAEGICDFVLREMRDGEGGFYSSIDADSDGEEGKYYRWTEEELKAFQSLSKYDQFASIYQLDGEPNFEADFFVLSPRENLAVTAASEGVTVAELVGRMKPIYSALLEARGQRQRPITDTKILTAWNGLMIASLADVGRLLNRKDYLRAAVEALDFLLEKSRNDEGRLLRSYARGEAKLDGYLDDYAFLISGVLALHRATEDARLIEVASQLMDMQIQWFWDDEEGGFFFTASDHPESIVRLKNPVDGAIPSGISVSAENLRYLIKHGADRGYAERLDLTFRSVMPLVTQAPVAATRLAAVATEIVDVTAEDETNESNQN